MSTSENNRSMVAILFRDDGDFSAIPGIRKLLIKTCVHADIDAEGEYDLPYPLLFTSRGFICQVMFINQTAPLSADDPEFRNAWFWPEAWTTVSRHQSHIILSVTGGDTDTERALLFQSLVHAIACADEAISAFIYVRSGTIVPRKALLQLAEQREPSIALIMSCVFAREAEGAFPNAGILAATKGLTDLGLMELEARGYVGDVSELHQFVLNFAEYLQSNKPPLRDGDTIGSEGGAKIGVRIAKSLIYDKDVLRLNFQQ